MSIEPIRHLVVLAHPRRGSFNHQIADAYCEAVQSCGQVAYLRDLYANRFDPILEIIPEAPDLGILDDVASVRNCDILTFVYPIWFGLPPAMIKGYVDRVLGAGFKPTSEQPRGDGRFLGGKRLLSFTTSASTSAWLGEQGQLTTLRDGFDNYLATVFDLASTDHVHIDSIVDDLDPIYAKEQLERVRETARKTCAELLNTARRAETGRKVDAYARKIMDAKS
ncbi:MAG: NAD(P)H-dependent oxidoreductase [Pseudomonadota bacterium]